MRLNSAAVSALNAIKRASTSASGLMSSSLSRSTSTFGLPTVDVVAMSCRLMFDGHTRSGSTMVICLTPERTSASTHQLPTPPTPNTMTRVAHSLSVASSPSSSRVLDKSLFIINNHIINS